MWGLKAGDDAQKQKNRHRQRGGRFWFSAAGCYVSLGSDEAQGDSGVSQMAEDVATSHLPGGCRRRTPDPGRAAEASLMRQQHLAVQKCYNDQNTKRWR